MLIFEQFYFISNLKPICIYYYFDRHLNISTTDVRKTNRIIVIVLINLCNVKCGIYLCFILYLFIDKIFKINYFLENNSKNKILEKQLKSLLGSFLLRSGFLWFRSYLTSFVQNIAPTYEKAAAKYIYNIHIYTVHWRIQGKCIYLLV